MKLPANTNLSSYTRADISDGTQHNEIPAFKLVDDRLQEVKKLINEQLATSVKTEAVNKLLEYVNAGSGKMIRPGLVLLAGSAVGKITEQHVRIAAIFEMIHNATLLHDDVIDNGQRRRGRPTVNTLWGNESAVLLGDFLLSRVFKMCSELQPQVAKEIAATAAQVCEGELRQTSESQNWQLSESQYIDIITEKSAALFSTCCSLGGKIGGAGESEVRSLADFGVNAGIAFQIADDLLDIVGDEERTGKTLGRDADKKKPTLAVIHLLDTADEAERDKVRQIPGMTENGRTELGEMLERAGSLEYARGRADDYVGSAVRSLDCLPDCEAKEALAEFARFMVSRVA